MQKRPLKFSNQNNKDFEITLNKRVNQFFKQNNISKTANGLMIFKTIFFLTLWAGSFALIMLGGLSLGVTYVLWAIFGFSIAMVCVNVGHDAIHGAYSDKKWVNKLLSHTFNINGASAYMWTKMHNSAHHTYANIEGYDEDIESLPIIRMSPEKKLKSVHKYQHVFAPLFYGLATLSWVLIKDYVKFFKNEVGNYSGKNHPTREYFLLFFYKFINYSIFMVLPFFVLDFSFIQILLGLLLMHYVAGFTLASIFMLAHVVEETHFPVPDADGLLKNSRTVHQLYTTADFAGKSRLAGFLTGGLNLQVEHHLYPNICSIHYRTIASIVKETAEEFGVPYYESSFWGALRSHIRFLRKMGKYEKYVPITAAA